jgi:hypothetical protein
VSLHGKASSCARQGKWFCKAWLVPLQGKACEFAKQLKSNFFASQARQSKCLCNARQGKKIAHIIQVKVTAFARKASAFAWQCKAGQGKPKLVCLQGNASAFARQSKARQVHLYCKGGKASAFAI